VLRNLRHHVLCKQFILVLAAGRLVGLAAQAGVVEARGGLRIGPQVRELAQARAGESQSHCSSCEKMLIIDFWARVLLIPELGFAGR
jgi:hypothetical protein